MTYQEAESFLFNELQSFQDKGRIAFNGTLDNAYALSEILGNPHEKFKSIHVGGTNGKGSVSHIIAAGLQANGYKVGLYTSPHYRNYRERIKINGEFISEENVAYFIQKYKTDIIRIKPSFFEITCAMAFDHFAKNGVDAAVIEVGLGGRLDSTNILKPLQSIITNISLDHQAILGNTIQEIAAEKAGIFKSYTNTIIGEKQKETSEIYQKKASEVGAFLHYAEDNSTLLQHPKAEKNRFTFNIDSKEWQVKFESHHNSPFQIKNLRTSLYALFHLTEYFKLELEKIALGIKEIHSLTYFIGRWSVIQHKPKVIIDSAHNLAGVSHLVQQLQNMKYETLRIIWGSTQEKDVNQILTILPKDAIYYFAQAQNSRAMDVDKLKETASSKQLIGYAYNTVNAAYQIALAEANENDIIIVSGSSFVVAEVI